MTTKRALLRTSFFLAFGCLLALQGAALGVDVPFGQKGWSFCTSIRYFETDLEATAETATRSPSPSTPSTSAWASAIASERARPTHFPP